MYNYQMLDILKIILVFAVMIILLKRRWNLGIVMALSSVMLAVLYLLTPVEFLRSFLKASTEKSTLMLVIALTLIRIFENIMRKKGIMKEMMNSFRGMARDRRILMASMPALIGLLPSMGGALFSAPMVDEASKDISMPPEKKAFINYIFRHPWEFVSPLYPGLILASAITSLSIRDIIVANLPYAFCLVAGGILWGLRGLDIEKESFKKISRHGLISFIPLTVIILMVMVLHIDLSLSMGLVIVGLYAVLRYSFSDIVNSIKEGFSWEIVVITLGVMTFKAVLESSGAVISISTYFSNENIPLLPVIFILPFLSGLLTGLTIGFVGTTFPILMGLENANQIGVISFAFAAGYAGVLLSPVHLCLILTREYFKSTMSGIYHGTVKTTILVMVAAVIEYFILTR